MRLEMNPELWGDNQEIHFGHKDMETSVGQPRVLLGV